MKKSEKKRLRRRLREAKGLEKLDLAVGAWAARAGRKAPMRQIAALAELADQPPLMTVTLATWAAGAVRKDQRLSRAGREAFAAFAIATVAKAGVKRVVARTRPGRLLDRQEHRLKLGGPPIRAFAGFPSGHTAGGVAAARAIGRRYPGLGTPLMAQALTLGALKVFRGDHFPSDVLAGFALGLLSDRVAQRALSALN